MKRSLIVLAITSLATFDCKSANDPTSTVGSGAEHAVIISFQYGQGDLEAIYAVEEELEDAVRAAAVGEVDGHEISTTGSEGSLYLYGADGDRLYAAVRPVLERTAWMRGAQVTIRHGAVGSGASERTLQIRSTNGVVNPLHPDD